MRRLAAVVAVVLALPALAAVPRPARACSFPQDRQAWVRYPQDASTGVPTNTRLWVDFTGDSGLSSYALRLRLLGSEDEVPIHSVATAGGIWSWQSHEAFAPDAELAPETTYELLDNRTGDFLVVATFTTAAGADLAPPVFTPVYQLTVHSRDICESDSCCGPYDHQGYSLAWSEASDDGPLVYDLAGNWLGSPEFQAWVNCSGQYDGYGPQPPITGDPQVTVSAIDMAGNVTVGAPSPAFEVACEPVDDGTESPLGCDVGAGRRGGLPTLLVLAAVAATAARRRRQSCP